MEGSIIFIRNIQIHQFTADEETATSILYHCYHKREHKQKKVYNVTK